MPDRPEQAAPAGPTPAGPTPAGPTPAGPTPAGPVPSISGHEDPPEEAPWAMPLVVRLERSEAPTHLAVCEAAAMAVVRLLADPRCAPGGPWEAAVRRWSDGRIRKVVRRARGAPWEQTAQLDQVSVDHAGAQVRAFVPGPTDRLPRALAKLQVAGSDAPTRGTPSPVTADTLRVRLNPRLAMSTGKSAAQAGHAAQLAWAAMPARRRAGWAEAGFPVSVELPDPLAWERTRAPVTVRDAGFTEIAPGSVTAMASW